MMFQESCRKCHHANNWFHGYCIVCWAELPEKKKLSTLAWEVNSREIRKLRR